MADEAIAELQEADWLSPSSQTKGFLGRGYAVSGWKRDAQKVLRQLYDLSARQSVSAYDLASIHLGLGQTAKALELLDRACDERQSMLVYLRVLPEWQPVRTDERFVHVLRRVGITW